MADITGKHLIRWGIPQGPALGKLLKFVNDPELYMHRKRKQALIKDLAKNPANYLEDEVWREVAEMLMPKVSKIIPLNEKACPVNIFGEDLIEQGALDQIDTCSKLPVALSAALMPDAHQGYGLPIGGVLATANEVVPYAVGVDIACQMRLTITDIPFASMKGQKDKLAKIIQDNTVFGIGPYGAPQKDHPVLDDPRFKDMPFLKKLHKTAVAQIGSSGGGNHFVEFGSAISDHLGVQTPMLAILSHSGSRGVGAKIADYYTEIAIDQCKLPKEAKHLAWLGLDTEWGQEYWHSMHLAGDFAEACHEVIHYRISKVLGSGDSHIITNKHNFAWEEKVKLADGSIREGIVHRKGATPAGKGVLGIIPGSMSTPTYIVSGKGNSDSINSSSHGAGRLMSRKSAKETITGNFMRKDLEDKGITLIGASVDECTAAYKNIDDVISMQTDLVDVIGEFTPWIVRMAEDNPKPWEKKK